MTTINFGSRGEANEYRDRVDEFRAESDDRRKKTLELVEDTPEQIIERLQERAFASRSDDGGLGGVMAELSRGEKAALEKQHRGFEWQQHGFGAMRAKGALEARGVTDWMNYYEPGEGTEGALKNLNQGKNQAQQTRAPTAIEQDYTDMEEMAGNDRVRRQSERMRADQVKSAKRAAIVDVDPDAREFLEEERRFEDDLFDISFGPDDLGLFTAKGSDAELAHDRMQQRSAHARLMDRLRSGTITTDIMQWAANPSEYDYPGVDTLDPELKHSKRSKRAREVDERELAPRAASRREWASDMDDFDLPGVDTPPAMRLDPAVPFPDVDVPDMGLSWEEKEAGIADDPGLSIAEALGIDPVDDEMSPDDRPTTTPQSLVDAFASGEEADIAFERAETERAAPEDDFSFVDSRPQQDTLDVADATQHRESRIEVERNQGGLLGDTRQSIGRGPDTGSDSGDQEGLDAFGDQRQSDWF